MRLVAVGDIHGHIRMLDDLLAQISEPPEGARDKLIFLGDYIDRGPDSKGVIDRLIALRDKRPDSVFVMGNHEHHLVDFAARGDLKSGGIWMVNGGAETLESYGVTPPRDLHDPGEYKRARRELKERLPEAHRRFLADLQLHHCEGDYIFVHAGLRPGVPLADQRREDVMWIREKFLRSKADFGGIVVHGHTPADRPEVRRNRIGIDTGAGKGGYLTAALFWGTEISFLHTGPRGMF